MKEYMREGEKLIHDLEVRHQNDLDVLRSDLEKQLPYKVK